MKIKIKILLLTFSLNLGQTLYAQISFPKNTDDRKIVSTIFEGHWVEKDSACQWIPNFSERIQFGADSKDTLRTKIDTIFNYKEYNLRKIILTTTFATGSSCHACQPSLGMIELRLDEDNNSYIIERVNKYITGYGTWGEAPKKRNIFQLDDNNYCIKIIENYSGGGSDGEYTSLFKEGKKIFSFCSYLNETTFEYNRMNRRFRTSIYFDKKTNRIKIIKKGKEKNDSGKIVKVNSNSSYKYDGEFLIKEYTRNLKAKK